LMNSMTRIPDIAAVKEIEQLGERAAAAMGAAFRRRDIGDAFRFPHGASIIVHQPERTWLSGGIDQQQRAGCVVNGNAFHAAEIDRLPEFADGRDRGLPPKLPRLIDGGALLARCGEHSRGKTLDVALRVDSACANAAGPHIDAQKQTCHWNSPPLALGSMPRLRLGASKSSHRSDCIAA